MYRRFGWAILLCAAMVWPAVASAQNDTDEGESPSGTESGGESEAQPAEGGDAGVAAGEGAAENTKTDKQTEKGTYAVRLRDLEDRINRLKEQIFRSKARLSLLAETVLDRKIAGAKASIVFRNEMGGSFRLTKATFLLDGGPVFNKSDEGGNLAERDVIDLFDGPVMPGDHTISVVLHYRGHGYGIFSYLKGYSFKVRSSRTFTVSEGKAVRLEVVGFEQGGVTTPLEERPAVRYIENMADYQSTAAPADEGAGAEGGGEF